MTDNATTMHVFELLSYIRLDCNETKKNILLLCFLIRYRGKIPVPQFCSLKYITRQPFQKKICMRQV